MAVGDAHMFPGFLTPVLTQLFFPKPPTTFLTCFCRGERRDWQFQKYVKSCQVASSISSLTFYLVLKLDIPAGDKHFDRLWECPWARHFRAPA